MACSCQGNSGTWEIVHPDNTVSGPFATKQLAQAAIVASGRGGMARQKAKTSA